MKKENNKLSYLDVFHWIESDGNNNFENGLVHLLDLNMSVKKRN